MEFQEFCRHISRMCYNTKCADCPLQSNDLTICEISPLAWKNTSQQTEQIVANWAKEHPEPVYETWYDYLDEIGLFENCQETPKLIVAQILNKQHIPPDIGKKLGLKPVNEAVVKNE